MRLDFFAAVQSGMFDKYKSSRFGVDVRGSVQSMDRESPGDWENVIRKRLRHETDG